MTTIKNYIGSYDLLKSHKISFLCSRKCPAHIVLKSYDWAINQREKGNCVISGFHSKIEKDIFHFLLKGNQPVILALARCLKKTYDTEIQKALNDQRLLILSPFDTSIRHITSETSKIRNHFMCELSDEIFVAFASPESKLLSLIKECIAHGKTVFTFDVPENSHLIEMGVMEYRDKYKSWKNLN